jgi:phytoene dehydrogenase-like protein
MRVLEPSCRAARALPLLAIRPGLGLARTLGGQALNLLAQAGSLAKLGGTFGPLARRHLSDHFLLHWVDLLCFLISGLPMDQTSAAAMATLFGEWFEPGACLDYPLGGSAAVVAALQRGMERHGGSLHTNTPVAEVCLEHKRAVGVRLHDGSMIRARRGVISNASPWDTLALINPRKIPSSWGEKVSNTPACHGFS